MSYRYYSTQRPLGPGAFPRPAGNRVEDITNYDRRTYIEELGREAWGSIDYEQPLIPEDARAYELMEAAQHPCAGCVNEEADRSMDCCWDCNRNPRRKRQDLYRPRH